MKSEDTSPWGARIERGKITAATGSGTARRYTIESIDRPGVTLYAMPGAGTYGEGALVYFFAFRDGKGLAIAEIN